MELSFHLKTLPEEALDILRYYIASGAALAGSDDIRDGSGLSERGYSKGIKRLVTKGFLTMEGNYAYRLTRQGSGAIQELAAYDASAPARVDDAPQPPRTVTRRLIVAMPRPLVAGQPVNVFVGFNEADDDNLMRDAATLVVRLTMVNGEPSRAKESPFVLSNRSVRQVFEAAAGAFTRARLRVQVYQMSEDGEDIWDAGGMYVDVDVTSDGTAGGYASYGADVLITVFD